MRLKKSSVTSRSSTRMIFQASLACSSVTQETKVKATQEQVTLGLRLSEKVEGCHSNYSFETLPETTSYIRWVHWHSVSVADNLFDSNICRYSLMNCSPWPIRSHDFYRFRDNFGTATSEFNFGFSFGVELRKKPPGICSRWPPAAHKSIPWQAVIITQQALLDYLDY